MRCVPREKIDEMCSIYGTIDAYKRVKYTADVERSLVARNFQQYIEFGGILGNSIDYSRLKRLFPKGI